MKTFVRLIRRYVLAAVGIVLLLVFLGLGLLVFLGWQETTHLPQRTYASSEIADAMVETPAGLALGAAHTPEEWMDGYAWAMVLDDTGNIRWSYALPDALNHAYTTGEVAGFARWYLDDYPVFCWAEDYGLFVIGLARGSLWKCSIYTSPEYILNLAKTIPLGFGLLLLLAAICCFLLSWQGAKRLETVASGLDALAEGQTVQLPTEGFAGELAEKLNETGEQLRRFMEWSAAFFKTWKPDEVTIAFDPSVRYYLYDAFEGVNYELDVSKEPGHRIKNLKWPNGKAVKDTDTFVVAVNNYRATTQLLTAADIFLPGEDLPKLLEIDVRGDVGGIRELLGEYIRTVKGGTIEPHVNNNWKIVGNNWKAADHQKAVQLLREGKLALNENADARTLPGKAITTAEIAKF